MHLIILHSYGLSPIHFLTLTFLISVLSAYTDTYKSIEGIYGERQTMRILSLSLVAVFISFFFLFFLLPPHHHCSAVAPIEVLSLFSLLRFPNHHTFSFISEITLSNLIFLIYQYHTISPYFLAPFYTIPDPKVSTIFDILP